MLTDLETFAKQRGRGVLVYGKSSTGKTSTLRGLDFKRGKIFSTPRERQGILALKKFGITKVDLELPKTREEFLEGVTDAVVADLDWYAIDTLNGFYEICWQDFIDNHPFNPANRGYDIWSYCIHWMEQMLYRVGDAIEYGKNVILLCQHCPQKDVLVSGPDLPGQIPERLARMLDFALRTDRVVMGRDERYRLSVPASPDYGKNLHGLPSQTMDNDVSLVLNHATMGGEVTQTIPIPVQKVKKDNAPDSELPTPSPSETSPPPSSEPMRLKVTSREELSGHNKITLKKRQYLYSLCSEAGTNQAYLKQYVKERFNCDRLTDIEEGMMEDITEHLTTKIDEKAQADNADNF